MALKKTHRTILSQIANGELTRVSSPLLNRIFKKNGGEPTRQAQGTDWNIEGVNVSVHDFGREDPVTLAGDNLKLVAVRVLERH